MRLTHYSTDALLPFVHWLQALLLAVVVLFQCGSKKRNKEDKTPSMNSHMPPAPAPPMNLGTSKKDKKTAEKAKEEPKKDEEKKEGIRQKEAKKGEEKKKHKKGSKEKGSKKGSKKEGKEPKKESALKRLHLQPEELLWTLEETQLSFASEAGGGGAKVKVNNCQQTSLLPVVGEVVNVTGQAFKIIEKIGKGGFGSVFKCSNGKRTFALKAETLKTSKVSCEVLVLKTSSAFELRHFAKFIDSGTVNGRCDYIAMTLLGNDLHKMKNSQRNRKFSMATGIWIAKETLAALEELHGIGYISRDVKPQNFAMNSADKSRDQIICILDFGLSHKYDVERETMTPYRNDKVFHGTVRYASLPAHNLKPLGRRDDLESWLYTILELLCSSLPWAPLKDRELVKLAKLDGRRDGNRELFKDCSRELKHILCLIDSLEEIAEPPFLDIRSLLDQIQKSKPTTLDWEETVSSSEK